MVPSDRNSGVKPYGIFTLLIFIFNIAYAENNDGSNFNKNFIFTRLGGTKYEVFSEDSFDHSLKGIAIGLEYNYRINKILFGPCLEFQYLSNFKFDKDDSEEIRFIIPGISIKYLLFESLCLGTSLSYRIGKHAKIVYGDDEVTAKDKSDLWINGNMALILPSIKTTFLSLEGRFGYNLTKKQWESRKYTSQGDSENYKTKINKTYDIGFYVGTGYSF